MLVYWLPWLSAIVDTPVAPAVAGVLYLPVLITSLVLARRDLPRTTAQSRLLLAPPMLIAITLLMSIIPGDAGFIIPWSPEGPVDILLTWFIGQLCYYLFLIAVPVSAVAVWGQWQGSRGSTDLRPRPTENQPRHLAE
jgi:hypothetical protein